MHERKYLYLYFVGFIDETVTSNPISYTPVDK